MAHLLLDYGLSEYDDAYSAFQVWPTLSISAPLRNRTMQGGCFWRVSCARDTLPQTVVDMQEFRSRTPTRILQIEDLEDLRSEAFGVETGRGRLIEYDWLLSNSEGFWDLDCIACVTVHGKAPVINDLFLDNPIGPLSYRCSWITASAGQQCTDGSSR